MISGQAQGLRMFSAPTCTAVAPAIIISTTSSALATPPQPMTGMRHACATCHTMRRAMGNIAFPEKPPIPAATTGRRLRMSMRMPRKVFTSVSPSAPAFSQALAISTMSVTLGLSFTNTGLVVTALTAAVTSAAAFGLVPKVIPPSCTLGQDMLTSIMSMSLHASALAQQRAYSPTENPLILAITGPEYILRSAGTFSLTRASIPGFWSPTELIMPAAHSAILGVGLPYLAFSVVPFSEMAPSRLRSNIPSSSVPKPKVPLAGITGFFRLMPQRFTDRSFTIRCPPCRIQVRPCIFSSPRPS